MIDLHTHVLPRLDDGVRSLEEAVEVARAAHARGVTTLVATPHVRHDYPTTPADIDRGVAELRDALAHAGVHVDVAPGAEIAIDALPSLPDEELRRLALGEGRRYVLLEFPYHGWPAALEPLVHSLAARGLTPVLAHPERNAEVAEDPGRLAAATAAGCLVQVTASSVTGESGRTAARTARRLLQLGLVHALATDLHGLGRRDGALPEALALLGDAGHRAYLADEAPRAILSGAPVPPPPRVAVRGGGRLASLVRR